MYTIYIDIDRFTSFVQLTTPLPVNSSDTP